MTPSQILDIFVLASLCITIIYAYKLHKQINMLRNNKDQLGDMIEGFNSATLRAEKSIQLLNKNAQETSVNLQQHIEKSQSYLDEIMFLIDRGATLAVRLEEDISDARELKKKSNIFEKKPELKKTQPQELQTLEKQTFKSEVEQDLYNALKTIN